MTSEKIFVYQLKWFGRNDGLWCNHDKISIHLPQFKRSWGMKGKKIRNIENKFYVQYDNSDDIFPLTLMFSAINDFTFTDCVHQGVKRANIFTTIEPK